MSAADLIAFWKSRFPDCLPVGWHLREALPSRWLRIHSLPESKRYAETEAEYGELLQRHNEVASEVLGSGACGLAISAWADDPGEVDWNQQVEAMVPDLEVVHAWSWRGDEMPLQIGVARVDWHAGRFDALIRAVANDRTSSVALFSPTTGELYAPYDGGADLIVLTSERKTELRKRWRSWLSARPDGL